MKLKILRVPSDEPDPEGIAAWFGSDNVFLHQSVYAFSGKRITDYIVLTNEQMDQLIAEYQKREREEHA